MVAVAVIRNYALQSLPTQLKALLKCDSFSDTDTDTDTDTNGAIQGGPHNLRFSKASKGEP